MLINSIRWLKHYENDFIVDGIIHSSFRNVCIHLSEIDKSGSRSDIRLCIL